MKKLLAPNGKPSNLNEKQYKLVRTPAFKKWFGDWEILAEVKKYSNEIKGVYKYVPLDDNSKIESFLFEISQQANSSKSERDGAIMVVGEKIVELSLKLFPNSKVGDKFIPIVSKVVDDNSEPLIVWHGTKKEFTIFGKDKTKGINIEFEQDYLFRKNTNYFHIHKKYAKTFGSKYGGFEKPYFLNIKKIKLIDNETIEDIGYWKYIYDDYVNLGFDGVYSEDGQYATLLNPNQIKLADGSNTTFDSNNDDIRYAGGGEIDEKYEKIVNEIKNAIIDLELPYLNEVDESNRYYLNKSKNDYGQSWYMIFLQENRPLEIRISDHSVTSTSRIMDDKYIAMLDVNNPFKYQTPKGIAKSLDLEFKRLKDIREKRNKLFEEEKEKRNYMNNLLQPFLYKLKNEKKSIGKNDRTYQSLEEITTKHPDWEYVFHYPNNGAYSFYFVKNDTSGSLSPNFINEQYFNFLNDNNYLKNNYKKGGRTIAQTPAPKKERIYGSNTNKEKSSQSNTSAKQIVFDEKTIKSIKNKVDKHNEENPNKLITLSSAKAVVRRGMGAYSSSHRPTIKGGKPNSRVAWGLARLNAFIYKVKNGVSKSGKYTQDDDLINDLNIKYNTGGDVSNASFENVKKDKVNYLDVLSNIWSNFNIKF